MKNNRNGTSIRFTFFTIIQTAFVLCIYKNYLAKFRKPIIFLNRNEWYQYKYNQLILKTKTAFDTFLILWIMTVDLQDEDMAILFILNIISPREKYRFHFFNIRNSPAITYSCFTIWLIYNKAVILNYIQQQWLRSKQDTL